MADSKPMSKSQIVAALAESTGIGKKDVTTVLEHLEGLIETSLGKKGPGIFVMPGLMKIKVKHKPKQPAKKGRNPKTGEEMMIAAKPASKTVRVLALKKLKEMVK